MYYVPPPHPFFDALENKCTPRRRLEFKQAKAHGHIRWQMDLHRGLQYILDTKHGQWVPESDSKTYND